ncbi:MAG: hypothetical protein AB1502_13370, partial [Thermodesulfobacteriota bacterium]
MKKILIGLLLVFLFMGVTFVKEASAQKEKLAPFITIYEGSGSVEIAGKVAKFIQEKLGVEIRFTSESHGVIHSRIKAEDPNFTGDMG